MHGFYAVHGDLCIREGGGGGDAEGAMQLVLWTPPFMAAMHRGYKWGSAWGRGAGGGGGQHGADAGGSYAGGKGSAQSPCMEGMHGK